MAQCDPECIEYSRSLAPFTFFSTFLVIFKIKSWDFEYECRTTNIIYLNEG